VNTYDVERTDILVIGAGGAGCRAAIDCARNRSKVVLCSKFPIGKSGATVVAETFYSAPFSLKEPEDRKECYVRDIVHAGREMSDVKLAQRLAEEGWNRIKDLENYGVKFKKSDEGDLVQLPAPGHTYARGLFVEGGGLSIVERLKRSLKGSPYVNLYEDVIFTKLLTGSKRVSGAVGVDLRKGKPIVIECKAVIIATGGYGALWSQNDVPCDCTGDGIVMAYHAGADLIDLEMALFYPSVLLYPRWVHGILLPHGLLSEQVKARFVNGNFDEFVPEKLPTRDMLNSLIFKEVSSGRGTPHGGVYFDLRRSGLARDEIVKRVKAFLPEKFKYLLRNGLDITKEPLEVGPMAHYTIGGIRINETCETEVGGLFAAGEAEGNLHGANRIGGNALAETQVFGSIAGETAARWANVNSFCSPDPKEIRVELRRIEKVFEQKKNPLTPSEFKKTLQTTMWKYVGPNRQEQGLKKAISDLSNFRERDLPRLTIPSIRRFNLAWIDALETSQMLDLAEMVAQSALMRKETRGHHFRSDYPDKDDSNWLRHTIIRKERGEMKLWAKALVGRI
jgi:fumarate reductase (CoM/CoB) subunit A